MRRFRIPTLVLAATVVAGLLLALILALAVVVAMRESLGPRLDPGTDHLVRELMLWGTIAWLPFGGLIAWKIGQAIADRLEVTRGYARDLAWSEQMPHRPPTRIADVRRLEEALAGYFADVRDELAAALKHRDQALLLVNAVGEGLLQLDAGGHVVRLNPAAARLLKLPGDALGHPIGALIRHPELRRLLERPAPPDAAESAELDVEGRQLLVVRQPLRSGSEPGIIVLVVDLTPLRKLEDVRRDFVANVSHELKTPLTAIRGYLETLQDLELDPALRAQFLEAGLRNAERLRRIVDELLDLSRIESGGWRPHLTPVDACAAARDAWSGFVRRAGEQGVEFSVEAAVGCPAVRADPDGLRQILINLFDNALRYTPEGGHVHVQVARGTDDRAVTIAVSDNGAGIPAEALPRIFERFYRVDPSRSREAGGTGLGLSIVKHLVERMDGAVVAESRLGAGTTVRVRLPAAGGSLATAERS